jgi:hypothetical protein
MSGHPIKTISLKREMFVRGLDEQGLAQRGSATRRSPRLCAADRST